MEKGFLVEDLKTTELYFYLFWVKIYTPVLYPLLQTMIGQGLRALIDFNFLKIQLRERPSRFRRSRSRLVASLYWTELTNFINVSHAFRWLRVAYIWDT